MTRTGARITTVVAALSLAVPMNVWAQTRLLAAEAAIQETRVEPETYIQSVLRVGQDYTVKAGTVVREISVIFGDLTIEGRVDGDVVVVFGKAQLGPAAVIDGSLVVVGGSGSAAEGATIRQDLFVVGGGFDAPSSFTPGAHQIVVGPRALGGRLDALVPWVTRGLLWGRPIVPDLAWVWRLAAVFFFVSLALNLIFDRPARACADTLAEKPLTTFLVGLLVLLLTGPLCLLLTVSVIGIAVVPFVICALIAAALIGRIGATRWIGTRIVPQGDTESRLLSLRSFLIGSAVICVAYMIPLLGLFTWSMLGVFGLGAAALAFVTGYRRENPLPAPAPPPAPAAAASAVHYQPAPSALPNHDAIDAVPPVVPVAAASDLASFPHAFFRDRLFAFILDVILVLVVQQIFDLRRWDNDSAYFLLLLAYHIGFWTWKGTTVGGIICQLRVVRIDGAPLRFVDALVRGLSSIFSLAVVGIGCLWILRDPERQAWHDKIAGTYVVKVPRNWPI